ncbi:TonB-dependent receptor [Marinilongibacter aquaticus]|uniref:SusC/RagA family TonB-linked outer membrane protein n=1 Tax=Marinilongibacter aquaticus TaxID=2975157 RepID=UPI0021BDDEEF|nr:TonB-dependent receptor [Marinilongibacter aquaticus]UBM60867.1 TonB-dependent receptor [Marinilongibacter aquaticus]
MKAKLLKYMAIMAYALLVALPLRAEELHDKKRPLIEVLNEISETYHVFFSYESNRMKDLSVDFALNSGEDLNKVLNAVLSKVNYKFKLIGSRYYTIYPKALEGSRKLSRIERKLKQIERLESTSHMVVQGYTKKGLGYSAASMVQMMTVEKVLKGVVKDAEGQPVIGATVLAKGTTIGTITDVEGKFTLTVPETVNALTVSFIGYLSQDVTLAGKNQLEVVLQEDIAKLNEVVVVGYGQQKKRDITGAVVSVSEENFTQGANYNAAQLINGKASGVMVSQSSSAPGSGTRVQIRGVNSINGSNGVLYVVDGLPSVSISDLSPEDIESIEVLKDASSSAIYGTRAANGVVLITTKSGKKDKTELKYSAYYGVQKVAKHMDMLNGEQYMQTLNDIRIAEGKDAIYTDAEIAQVGKGTDWQDVVFKQSAPVTNHQLSLSGGAEKSSYYVGLNYFYQDGLIKDTDFSKINARTNLNFKPKEFIDFKLNMNITRSMYNLTAPSTSVNENAGVVNTALLFDPTLPSGLNENGRYYQNSFIAIDNPEAILYGWKRPQVKNTFYGTLATNVHFTKDLTGTIRVGGDIVSSMASSYKDRQTITGLSSGGVGSRSADDNTHWMTEFLLNYNKDIGQNQQLGLLAGTTFEQFMYTSVQASSRGFLSDVTGADLLQSGDNDNGDAVQSNRSRNRLHSVLGRLNYGLKDRYLLTASVRIDGTSRFSESQKYAVFPSAALGWRISDEPFFGNLGRTINELKLRLGYGKLGNQGINNYETLQTLVSGGSAVFGDAIYQGVVPARLPNANLKWETTSEVNIGLDYGLLNNRLHGSVEYYVRTTSDQLFNKPLPSVVGYSSIRVNFGKVQNRGFDIGLNSVNIDRKNFQWNSMLTVSTLKNEVVELPDFIPQVLTGNLGSFLGNYLLVTEGSPMQSYYGYEIAGIFQNQEEVQASAQPSAKPGEVKFVDQNKDGQINADDQVILGDPFPSMTIGLNNHFDYKGFTLDVFMQAVTGIQTFNANVAETLVPTNEYRNRIAKYYLNRWTPENPSEKYPSGVNSSAYFSGRLVNSLTVQDASFFRLKNVILGYDVPLADKKAISALHVYAAMDNILTFTKMDGFDPDANATSDGASGGLGKANYNDYPLNRTMRFGLNITF